MSSERRCADDYTEAEKRLLASCLENEPLDVRRSRDTARAARRQVSWGRPTSLLRKSAAAALVTVLLGASVWGWNGNSSDDLGLRHAVHVLRSPESYTQENLLAGVGKIDREIREMLQLLRKRGAVTPQFRAEVISILEGPPELGPYSGDLDHLKRVASHRDLSGKELQGVLEAIEAGVAAIRSLEVNGDVYRSYSRIIRHRLKTELSAE